MALPEGFCLPTDPKLQTAMTRLAQLDSVNITHVTAVQCTEVAKTEGFLSAWLILKTPRGSLGKRIPTRAALLAQYKKGLDGDLQRVLDQPGSENAIVERFKQVFGTGAAVNNIDLKPVDLDDNALYVGGTMDVASSGTTARNTVVCGLTRVKKHIFNYYRYEKVGETGTVVELLTRTLQLTKAEVRTFIKDNPE